MSIDGLFAVCPKADMIPSMRRLWKEAFGDADEAIDSFFGTAFAHERCRVIAEGNEVLGALYIFDCLHENRRIAYIYAVATRKKARGQGICGALMRDTHKYLIQQGYSGAILVPSEPSLFGFYQKFGYEICSDIGELETVAAENPVVVNKIEKFEFADNRRLFLPKNSVIQENENIDFLAKYASFYKGDGFLLAAHISDSKFFGAELLGNIDSAPAILSALGCEKGVFRVPCSREQQSVKRRGFAMYLGFDNTPAPQYFGLAFD